VRVSEKSSDQRVQVSEIFFLTLSEKIFENTKYLHSVTFLASLHKELPAAIDDNVRNEHALQLEITAYLGPVAVTDRRKNSRH